MRIDVIGKHTEVTDAIRQYALQKADKLTKFFDGVQLITVRLEEATHKHTKTFHVEITVDVVKHRWWIIAGITLGVTGAIAAWTFLKTPIYQGRFLLLIGQPIEENKNSLKLAAQDILPQLGGENIDYETQIAVLKSPQLLNPILSKITPQYPDFTYSDLISKTGKSDLKISSSNNSIDYRSSK